MDPFLTKNLITTKDASELSGYTSDYLARLVRGGEITGKKIGHSWLVDSTSLEAFLNKQKNLKSDRARELASSRVKEYHTHSEFRERVLRSLTKKSPVAVKIESPVSDFNLVQVSFRSHLLALSIAFLVVVTGATLASAKIVPQFAGHVAVIAREAATGFNETFGDIPSHVASKFNAVNNEMRANVSRVATANIIASGELASPLLTEPDLSSLQMALGDTHRTQIASRLGSESSKSAFGLASATIPLITALDVQTFTQNTYSFFASPFLIADTLVRAYLTLGTDAYSGIGASFAAYRALIEHSGEKALALGASTRDMLAATPRLVADVSLAFGTAIIEATHAVIQADVNLAYVPATVAPATARVTVAFMGGIGDVLARSTARVPALAITAYLRATEAPARAAPALAQAVFNAEYAGARRFVTLANSVSNRYLALIETTGQAAYTGTAGARVFASAAHSFLIHTPAVLEDLYLGVLGKTALALYTVAHTSPVAAALVASAPTVSLGEKVALTTYYGIHGLFDSMTTSLAALFTPPTIAVSPSNTPAKKATTAKPLPVRAVAYSSTSYPTYTTVVQGISQDSLNQSLTTERNNILATVAGMIQPVAFQGATNMNSIQQVNMIQDLSNLIVRNGDFRGGNFDGGTLTNGISVSATTGTFTSLTSIAASFGSLSAGATNIATTTVTGELAVSGAFSSNTSITAPYFIATSTTATSTFAGSFAIGTTTPFGNGLLTVGTSSPLLHIDRNTGNIGIGTSSPFATLSVAGDGFFNGALSVNGNTTLSNATSTNFFATTASSTNLFAQTANVGTFAASGASTFGSTLGVTGLATFANGFLSLASSTITNGLFSMNGGASTTNLTASGTGYFGNGYITGGLGIGVATTSAGTLQTSGNAWVGGNLTVIGNSTTLGASTADSLIVNSSIKSNLIPDQSITYDIGSPSLYWKDIYVGTLTANNISAASTTIGGTQSNLFTINTDNMTSDTENSILSFFRGSVVPNALLTWNSAPTAKRFEFNQPLYIQNASASTTLTTFDIKAVAGQTADLLRISSSSAAVLLNFSAAGNLGLGNSSPAYTLDTTGNGHFTSYVDAANFVATSSSATSLFNGALSVNGNTTLSNATSTNFFATTASSTNLFSQTANVGTFAASGAGTFGSTLGVTGLATFANGFLSLASSTITNGLFSMNGGASTTAFTNSGSTWLTSLSANSLLATDANKMLVATSTIGVNNLALAKGNFLVGNDAGVAQATSSIFISSTGSVGIGTASPAQKLDVAGNINTSAGSAYMYNGTNVITASTTLFNYFFGGAGNLTMTGTYNTANGYLSFLANTTGSQNVAYGFGTLNANTTGSQNTALGSRTLVVNTTGSSNTASGYTALLANTTGSYNTANGMESLFSNTTGSYNTAIGKDALFSNTTGYQNTASGVSALLSNTTGYNNTANGMNALTANTIGTSNTANGAYALLSNTTGTSNTANGLQALQANITGDNNTAVGYGALYANTAGSNTAVGMGALYANTTGTYNTAVGASALYANTTGSNNISIGYLTDYNSGVPLLTNSNSIFIGNNSNTSVDGLTNVIVIGTSAQATQSNQVVLGNTSVTQTLLNGNVGIGSTTPYAKLSITGAGATTGVNFQTTNSSNSPLVTMLDNGNVGIGTVSPGSPLQVSMTNSAGSGSVYGMQITPTYTQGGSLAANTDLLINRIETAIGIGTQRLIDTQVGGVTKFNVSNTGQGYFAGSLGIGTTTPWAQLSVNPNGITGPSFVIGSSTATNFIVTNGGNVGIGSTTPYAKLSITGAGATTGVNFQTTNSSNSPLVTMLDNGNVGIGTTVPDQALNVKGIIHISDGASPNYLQSDNTWGLKWKFAGDGDTMEMNQANTAWQSNITAIGGVTNFRWATTKTTGGFTGDMVSFNVNGVNTFYGNNSVLGTGNNYFAGNVGIGTTSPAQALSVQGNGLFSGNISAANLTATGTASFGTTTLTNLAVTNFSTSTFNGGLTVGTNQFVVQQATGNVGVGTTGPGNKLTVSASNNSLTSGILQNGATTGYNFMQVTNTSGGAAFGVADSSGVTSATNGLPYATMVGSLNNTPLQLLQNDVARLTIDTQGNVGIGTIAPAQKLDVAGNINTSAGSAYMYNGANVITASTTLFNYFFGNAGNLTMTGNYNTASGYQALLANTTGSGNTANGVSTLQSNNTGSYNTTNGVSALYINTTGSNNTASGANALFNNTTGSYNTASGYQALFNNTTGSANTANGMYALYDLNITANDGSGNNTALGYNTGRGIVTGINNTILGANVTGLAAGLSNNIILADGAGNQRINVGATGNVGIGSTTPYAKLSITGAGATTGVNFQTTNSSNSPLVTMLDNGNVGIGTTNPLSTLNVAGTTGITWANFGNTFGNVTLGAAGTGGTLFVNTASLASNYASGFGVSGTFIDGPTYESTINLTAYGVSSPSAYGSNLTFRTTLNGAVSERMRIDKNGNVGIGTTSPSQMLTVGNNNQFTVSSAGVVSAAGGIAVGGTAQQGTGSLVMATGAYPYSSAAGALYAGTRKIIESAGNSTAIWDYNTTSNPVISLSAQSSVEGVRLGSATNLAWSSTADPAATSDTNFSRLSAGKLALGNGTNGDYTGTLIAGNVGIGTTSPYRTLSVSGSGVFTGGDVLASTLTATSTITAPTINATTALQLNGTNINTAGTLSNVAYLNQANTFTALNQFNGNASTTQLTTTGSTYLATAGGNVGIGTAAPASTLEVRNNQNGVTRTYLVNATTGSNAAESLYVGQNTAGNQGVELLYNNAGNGIWGANYALLRADSGATGGLFIVTGATAPLTFGTSGAERMRIDSSGNVGIGTVNPGSTLDVSGTTNITGTTTIQGLTVGKGLGAVADNTALGVGALGANTTGSSNTAVGYRAGFTETSGVHNTFLGANAGYLSAEVGANTGIGSGALYTNAGAGGGNNTAVGKYALNQALQYENTAVGSGALAALGTGVRNVALGYLAGNLSTSGNTNILIGYNVQTPTVSTSNFLNIGNTIYGDTSTGNVGIGTTSPYRTLSVSGSGVFTGGDVLASTLTATSTITAPTINATTALQLNGTNINTAGTLSNVAYLNQANTFTALNQFNGNASTTQLTTTGSTYLATAGGNVGIGTAGPLNLLSVGSAVGTNGNGYWYGGTNASAGFVSINQADSNTSLGGNQPALVLYNNDTTANNFNQIVFASQNTSNGKVGIASIAAQAGTRTGNWGAGQLIFSTSRSGSGVAEAMRINNLGNVGIGTTTPNYALTITTNGANEQLLLEDSGAVANQHYWTLASSRGNFAINSATDVQATTTRLSILSNGNVGIGTTNPSQKLDVAGNINTSAGSAYMYNGANVITASTTLGNYFFGNAGNLTMTGINNTASGVYALISNTTGSYNTANGFNSLYYNTGTGNTAYGAQASQSNTTGSYNTSNGMQSLLSNTTGNNNTAFGRSALYSNTSDDNTALGFQSGYGVSSGARNVLIGPSTIAASYNQVTTGSNNISIGNDVAVASPTANNQLNIGNLIYGTGLNGTGATLSTGNVGIGTTSPGALFDVYGTGSAQARFPNGSVIAGNGPGISFTSYPNDGLASNGGNLVFWQNGTIALDLTDSTKNSRVPSDYEYSWSSAVNNNSSSDTGLSRLSAGVVGVGNGTSGTSGGTLIAGNVGIGSTTPYAKLSITGAGATTGVNFQTTNSSNSPLVTMLDNGNVGIGTASPGAMLDVAGEIRSSSVYKLNLYAGATSAASVSYDPGNANLILSSDYSGGSVGAAYGGILFNTKDTGGTSQTRVKIAPNGNVGIGTIAPAQKLDVAGNINISAGSAYMYNGANVITASTTLFNYFFGNAGNLTMTGTYNTASGLSAFFSDTTGYQNTANGSYSLYSNTTGYQNTANGFQALYANIDGYANTASGVNALQTNTSGTSNTAIGHSALFSNTTGYFNTASGRNSLYSNTTGTANTATGLGALYYNTTGADNTALGVSALQSNTTGSSNTASGKQALYSNTTGTYNTASGYQALYYNQSATSSTAIGFGVAYGTAAYSNQGGTYVGYQSGYSATTGSDYNTLLGFQSGYGVSTGARNVLLGPSTIAASYNQVTTGSNNIAIGNDVAVASPTASNQLNIGNLIYGTGLSGTGATLSTGNIGIGTTSPTANLVINGTTGQNLFQIATSTNQNIFVVNQNGKVGIGNAAPSQALQVYGRLALDDPGFAPGTQTGYLEHSVNGFIGTDTSEGIRSGNGAYYGSTFSNQSKLQIDFYGNTLSTGDFPNANTVGLRYAVSAAPSLPNLYDQRLLSFTGTVNSTGAAIERGLYTSLTDNSASITNTLIGITADVSGGTNTSANRYAALLLGGNVGIGTTSPNWNLQIAGTRPSFALTDTGATAGLKHWLFSSMGGNLYIGTSTDAYATSTPSAVSISNNGNLAIGGTGTSTIAGFLDVNGTGTNATSTFASNLWVKGALKIGAASLYLTGSGIHSTDGTIDIVSGVATSTFSRIDIAMLNVTSTTATSTFANGINLAAGCFAVNGVCVGGGSGAVSSVSNADGTLTISPTTGAVVSSLNLAHANTWTALQQFNANASTTALTVSGSAWLTALGTPAGTFLAVDANGKVIATTTPAGGGSGTVGSGTTGQFPYYASAGTTLTATSSLFLATSGNVGIGTTTIAARFAIQGNGGDIFNLFDSTGAQKLTVLSNGNLGIGTTSPWTTLSVNGNSDLGTSALAGYFTATSATATSTISGGLNVGSGGLVYDYSSGVTSVTSLNSGALNFPTDSGILSWVDMPVTSASAINTVESYSAQINGNPLLTVYSEADGAGGIQNYAIGIGSTTPFSKLSVTGTSGSIRPLFTVASSTGTSLLTVLYNGNVGISSTTPGSLLSIGTTNGINFSTATSTFNSTGGINLASGCFAVGGVCVGGAPGSGTTGQFPYYASAGTTLTATSSLFLATSGNVGIGTTTIAARFAIQGNGGDIFNLFDSTGAQKLTVLSNGNLGIGTTSPFVALGIVGNERIKTTTNSATAFAVENASATTTFAISTLDDNSNILSVASSTGASYFEITSAGNVGIGTTSPETTLTVVGSICAARSAGTQTTACGTTQGAIYANTSSLTGGYDVAEMYPTLDTSLSAGEVVSFDTLFAGGIARAASASAPFLGIISTTPGLTLGSSDATTRPLTLSGRVPTKVSAAGGAIAAGDRLMLSTTTPGVAVKAVHSGETIGVALAPYSGSGTGSIDVFVSSQYWFAPSDIAIDGATGNVGIGTTTPNHTLTVAGDVGAIAFVNTSTREAKTDITYVSSSRSADMFNQLVNLKIATYRYKIEDQSDPLRLGFISEDAQTIAPEILSPDGKGVDLYKLATFTLAGVQTLAAKVDAQDMRLTSLENRVAKLDGGAVSVASGSPITLSTTSLASAFEGMSALIQKGIAQFNTLVFRQLVASKDADGTSSAGSVTILTGNTVAQVNNSLVKPSTKVFVTFNAQLTGSWWVSDKTAGSFRVVLSAPQTSDVSFDYFLVQTEGQIATSTPDGLLGVPQSSTVSQSSGPDTVPPTIALLGANPVHLSVGGTFTEPGVTVADNADGTDPYITFVNGIQQEASAGTIDTSSATTYVITYKATDRAGNNATAMRSVIVGNPDGIVPTDTGSGLGTATTTPVSTDTTPPVVTLTGAVAIQLTAGDTFTDPGAAALDDIDGDLTASIVKTGTVDTATVGLYTLTYTATDKAGNVGSVSRVVTVVVAAPAASTTASSTPLAQ